MPEAVILEFHGVAPEQYDAVNRHLGLDPVTGAGEWPAGMLSHTGAMGGDDNFVVFEVWDSRASQEAFMGSALGAGLAAANVPPPVRVEWFTVKGHHAP